MPICLQPYNHSCMANNFEMIEHCYFCFYTGQNRSITASNVQTRQNNSSSVSAFHEITGTISKTSTALSSEKTSSFQFMMSTTNPLNKTNFQYSTSALLQPTSSKLPSTPSSTVRNIRAAFSSYSHSPTKSSEMFVSSTSVVNSFVFATSSNFSFPTTLFMSSTFHKVSNSSSTDSLTSSSRRSNSVAATSSINSSTAELTNTTSHFSLPPTMFSTYQGVHSSSTHLLSSPMEGNATLTIHSSTLISSSPPRSSSFSSSTLFTSTLTPFSTSMVVTKTIGNTTITSSRESSADHLSSFTKEIPSTSSVSAMFSTSQGILSSSTNLLSSPMEGNSTLTIHSSTLIASHSPRSSSITFVRPTPSEKQTLPTKSSEANISSSTITKMAPSSAANVLNYIFLKFDGKLIVSPKSSYKAEYISFKKLAGSIESILDKALQQVNGYIYSKILIITPRDDESKFVCTFKVFLTKPSSETAATLQEKINKYNETNGFGEFTLHSVETSDASNQPSTEERLYTWAIIVIAALGVLCLLSSAAFIYAQVCRFVTLHHSSEFHNHSKKNSELNISFLTVLTSNILI